MVKKRTLLESMENPNSEVRRRGFLQNTVGAVGGGFATLLGFSGESVALNRQASEAAREAINTYSSPDMVRKALQTHASALLSRLERDGHLGQGNISILPTDEIHESIKSYADSESGVLVHGTAPKGEPRVKIQLKRLLPDGRELVLVVRPRIGKSQAFFEGASDDTNGTYYTSTTNSDGSVTVQSCEEACDTPTERCSYACNPDCYCAKIKVYDSCTDPDCIGSCFYVDYSCCGDYDC